MKKVGYVVIDRGGDKIMSLGGVGFMLRGLDRCSEEGVRMKFIGEV